jgi:hypothetical protein
MAGPDRLLDIGCIQPALGEAHSGMFRPTEALDFHLASLRGEADKLT